MYENDNSPIKEYDKGVNKYIEQYKKETAKEKELFEDAGIDYNMFRIVKISIAFLVICSILSFLFTIVQSVNSIREQDRIKALELMKEELKLETSFSQNFAKNIIVENELRYKNGITIPLANKYSNSRPTQCSVGEAGIKNNISNFAKEIEVEYKNEDDYDKLQNEKLLKEFEVKLVEIEGYQEKKVTGEEGKVFFRKEKGDFFTYIIINDCIITYGIAKDNVEI